MNVEKLLHETFEKYEQYTPDADLLHLKIHPPTRNSRRQIAKRQPRSRVGPRSPRGRWITLTVSAVVLMLAGGLIVGLALSVNLG